MYFLNFLDYTYKSTEDGTCLLRYKNSLLAQVYKKIDQEEYPEYLVDQLVKYNGWFLGEDGKFLVKLVMLLESKVKYSRNRADYSDKLQFYGSLKNFPRR